MRQSDVYSFKRQSMKLQYEILGLGLKSELQHNIQNKELDVSEGERHDRSMYEDEGVNTQRGGLYNKFANFFVDDKENLKDIMQQLGSLSDDEERIKEELFLLLSFFILTLGKRADRIRNIIKKNKENLISIIAEFKQKVEDEDTQQLMEVLISTLENLSEA